MKLQMVTAIIRRDALEKVELRLQAMHVKGVTVTRVKGYGEQKDFFSSDWMVSHVRLEVFAERARADEIAKAILREACSGLAGDGLVVLLPVERVYRIRNQHECQGDEL